MQGTAPTQPRSQEQPVTSSAIGSGASERKKHRKLPIALALCAVAVIAAAGVAYAVFGGITGASPFDASETCRVKTSISGESSYADGRTVSTLTRYNLDNHGNCTSKTTESSGSGSEGNPSGTVTYSLDEKGYVDSASAEWSNGNHSEATMENEFDELGRLVKTTARSSDQLVTFDILFDYYGDSFKLEAIVGTNYSIGSDSADIWNMLPPFLPSLSTSKSTLEALGEDYSRVYYFTEEGVLIQNYGEGGSLLIEDRRNNTYEWVDSTISYSESARPAFSSIFDDAGYTAERTVETGSFSQFSSFQYADVPNPSQAAAVFGRLRL